MNGRIEDGPGNDPEDREKQSYTAYTKALAEEQGIAREITKVFANTLDRHLAEQIVSKKWLPALSKACEDTTKALVEWTEAVKKAAETERGPE